MSEYLMDDPREAQPLIDKVDAAKWYSKYLAPYLGGVGSVLEVGCGPGHILSEIHRDNPKIILHGVDISNDRLALARGELLQKAQARFYEAHAQHIPLNDDSVDLTFTRFLLEYVADKQRAVNEIARVTAPCGTVILQDIDSQFLSYYPNDIEVDGEVIQLLHELAKTGFDPNVGRKLYTYAYRAGLENLTVTVEPYHLYYGGISEKQLRLWSLKLEIASRALSKIPGRSQESIQQLSKRYLELLQRPDNFFYSALVTVVSTGD